MATGKIKKYTDGIDSGWIENKGIEEDSKSYTGSIFYRKIGSIVFVRGYGIRVKSNIAIKSYVELMQLPTGYRPISSTGTSAMSNSASNYDRVFPILIASSGQIYVYTNADSAITTSMNINFNFVYTVD